MSGKNLPNLSILSIVIILLINYETYLYIFDVKFSLKGTYNAN